MPSGTFLILPPKVKLPIYTLTKCFMPLLNALGSTLDINHYPKPLDP